jgi:hypothetical protein
MSEPKEIKVTEAELKILVEAVNVFYLKTMRHAQRTREFHSKEQNQQLQAQQKLLQYLMLIRSEREHPEPVEC